MNSWPEPLSAAAKLIVSRPPPNAFQRPLSLVHWFFARPRKRGYRDESGRFPGCQQRCIRAVCGANTKPGRQDGRNLVGKAEEGAEIMSEMVGRKPKTVPLDSQDEKLLQEMAGQRVTGRRHKHEVQSSSGRCRGERLCQVGSRRSGTSVASIRRACRRYQSEGIAGLVAERQRRGKPA